MAKKKQPGVKSEPPLLEEQQPVTPLETGPSTGSGDGLVPPIFSVVGIGASAGGLVAIEAFFAAMPADTESGMAFVVVQHLDPDHKSILIDLVKKYTKMRVYKVEDGMWVQPNCIYIIPPNCDMAFLKGKLHLLEPSAPRGLRLPIDFFFRSLAQDQRERAICVVLSGTGTDGTLGLKAVKGEGGMAMAQAPESAAYDGMPRSAIGTGLVDYVLPPDKMPEQLIAYVQYAFGHRPKPIAASTPKDGETMQKVFILLRAQTGHDFSLYKQNTIQRRIERRMAIAQLDHLEDYVHYLRENPREVETLFRELLIGVTNFFRDPQAFEALQEHVIHRLFASKPAGDSVRIWVPGCSSGEEAYSLAILIREHLDEMKQSFQMQVFATDIDTQAIERARAGVYPDSIAADVSPERLARFYTQENSSYKINKSIRDMVIFAKQDVLKDPPFSKLDLISCRNLLIYLDSEAQKKLLPLFHYALNLDGYLFLGNSETIGEHRDLFTALDKKWKIYQRKGVVTPPYAIAPYNPPLEGAVRLRRAGAARPHSARDLAERMLLETYIPASVLINAEFEVLFIHGHTGKYLEPAAGEASLNLLKMVRQGLRMELTTAVRKALAQQIPVRYDGLRVKSNGDTSIVNLIVQPVSQAEAGRDLLLVIFEDAPPISPPLAGELGEVAGASEEANAPLSNQEQHILSLERELRTKGEYLQATIEELETSNEELTTTNEEMQSSNEELQSTNEELETSKEELQSINEELMTVNTELQQKAEELSRVNNDIKNLMASTHIGTLYVDPSLRIQRFTPAMGHILKLIETDIGRPMDDIVSRLVGYDRMMVDTQAVLDTLIPNELEVQTREGQWYQMRIQPYRTLENVIDGAVLTFVDASEQKVLTAAIRESEEELSTLFDLLPVGASVLNGEQRIVYVNPALEKILGISREGLLGGAYTSRTYLRADGTPMRVEEFAGVRAMQEQQAVNHVVTGVVKEDGDVIWTDVSAVPVALRDWKVIVVTFDLAERPQAEETPLN